MALTVLGVDPGTRFTGWAIVRGAGSAAGLLAAGTIRSEGAETPFPVMLRDTYRALARLIAEHRPDEMAVEEAFVHRNALAALRTGSVRGVALLAGAEADLPIGEYNPKQVKQAITGRGAATKEQVAYMVRAIVDGGGRAPGVRVAPGTRAAKLAGATDALDSHALDAIAIALCHLWRRDRPVHLVAGAR
jgi:crossover junction endodeoxyribonuclease RuvC